jgi:hypothetical protein
MPKGFAGVAQGSACAPRVFHHAKLAPKKYPAMTICWLGPCRGCAALGGTLSRAWRLVCPLSSRMLGRSAIHRHTLARNRGRQMSGPSAQLDER